MSYTEVIQRIEKLRPYRDFICEKCGHKQQVYTLTIQSSCDKCGLKVKHRGYAAIGSEIEDVVDAVLEWLGQGDELKLAMQRKNEIDS